MPKAPKSAASSKQKRKPSDRGPALGPNAPISHLSMPLNAEELTLPELAAFLLRYLRSFDFCDRVTKNGVTRVPIANMVRYFCKLPKPLKDATIARMLQHAKWDILGREKGSGQNWKIRDEKKANLTNWDHGNLSTQGYQLNIERLSKSHLNISSIPFEHLAIDVEFMPEGDDTLYLTRCIRYALRSPGIYVYPQDFGRLIHITGGPVVVTLDHHDDAAAKRWVQAKPKPVASTEPSTEPAIDDRDNEPTTEIYDESMHDDEEGATVARLLSRF